MNYEFVGWIVSALAALPLVASGTLKIIRKPAMVKNMERVGFSEGSLGTLGVIELLSAILFVVPQTSFIGAILVTGWMGGAIAAHVRIRDNFVVQALIPTMAWIGFGLRQQNELWNLIGLK